MENVNKRPRIFLSLSKPECGPQEITSKDIRPHFTLSVNWNKRDIHFKSDFFAAVAVVDTKALYRPQLKEEWDTQRLVGEPSAILTFFRLRRPIP